MTGGLLLLVLALAPRPAATAAATAQAEQLAAEAVRLAAGDPQGALTRARRALALTADFEPTAFVAAGRKGEVVEDAFQSARDTYQHHRAVLYQAIGTVLAQQGQPLPASRYLGRAFLLQPQPQRGLELARVLVQLGRGREAIDVIERAVAGEAPLTPAAGELLGRAADVAGLPSAQAELDRARLTALGAAVTLREGPLTLPATARVSNAPVFRLEDAPLTAIYAAEASCRSCSADLEDLGRQVPKEIRVVALPAGDDQDAALRQVIALYRRSWPVLMGPGVGARLALPPRSLLLVGRQGWTLAVLKAPFAADVAAAIAILRRSDVQEQVPRAQWNRRPPDRAPLPVGPALLPDGLAPGEDLPVPQEFTAAVGAFRAGRKAEALKLFDSLEAKGDGWLLPPEARLDRALCLAGTGQRDAARRLLLRTGDSRFEAAIDTLLEAVARGR